MRQHTFGSKCNLHFNNWIKSLKKQGLKPVLEVLERVEEKDADIVEKRYIMEMRSAGCNLLNATDGGEGNFSPSEETRRKIGEKTRAALTGRKQPESQVLKRKLSLAGRRLNPHPSYFITLNKARAGIPLTEEHKRKVSESLTGKKRFLSEAGLASFRKHFAERMKNPEFVAKLRENGLKVGNRPEVKARIRELGLHKELRQKGVPCQT